VDVDRARAHSLKLGFAVGSHEDLVGGVYHVNLPPISTFAGTSGRLRVYLGSVFIAQGKICSKVRY
jgi:hypothetical protein